MAYLAERRSRRGSRNLDSFEMDVRGAPPPRAKVRWSHDSIDETYAELDDTDVNIRSGTGSNPSMMAGDRGNDHSAAESNGGGGSYETLRHFSMRSQTLAKNIFKKAQMLNALAAATDMPGWDSKIGEKVIKWTFLRLPIPLLLVLVALAMPVGVGLMYLDDPPVFDISLTSFTVPNHQQALLSDGAYAAKSNCTGTSCETHHCPAAEETRRHRRALYGGPVHSRKRRATSSGLTISVVYHGINGNVVSPQAVLDVHGIERSIAIEATSRGASATFNSLTMYFYPPNGQYVDPGTLLAEAEITAALDYAAGSTNTAGKPDALGATLYDFTSGFERTPGGTWSGEYIRSEVTIQESTTDEALQAWIDLLDAVPTDNVDVIYASSGIFNYQILQMMYADIYYVIYALIFVAAYMLFHTGSLFLTLVGIINILCAFPLGYFLYREVFGLKNLSILGAVTLFVVIGIGVDDIFVFIDMFIQPGKDISLERRMVHTMTTAARATLFTTATSASAFAANTLSEIPALSDFGMLTALVISCNYVLLVLVIPATLGFWWRYIKPIEDTVAVGLKWLICWPVMLAIRRTKKTAKESSSDPDRKARKQPGRGRKASLLEEEDDDDGSYQLPGQDSRDAPPQYTRPPNYDGSTPKIDDEEGTHKKRKAGIKKQSSAMGRIAAARDKDRLSKSAGLLAGLKEVDDDGKKHAGSFFSWFLYNIVGGVTVRGRYVCILVFAVFFVVACQQASLLQPAQKPPALVPDEHNLGKVEALSAVFDNWDSGGGDLGGDVLVNGGVVTVTDITATQAPTSTKFPSRSPTTPLPTPLPTTGQPTRAPSQSPFAPTDPPTRAPTTSTPSVSPTTPKPTELPNVGETDSPVTTQPSPSPSEAPSTSLPTTAPTGTPVASTSTPPVTIPSNDDAANVDVTFVFGLVSPYVDRSQADLTAFTEDRTSYLPLLDPLFNRGADPTADASTRNSTLIYVLLGPSYVESELLTQIYAMCDALVNDSTIIAPDQNCDDITFTSFGIQQRDCDNIDTGLMYLWFSYDLKSLFTKNDGSAETMAFYDLFEAKLEALRAEYPLAASVASSSESFEKAAYEQLAIDGSIWGIMISVLLCFIAVCLFKAHGTVVAITMTVIVTNVATVIAIFHMLGWTLGGVEAVSLSILVGTCVDYVIHMTEGYLEANPDHHSGLRSQALKDLLKVETDAQLRFWRVRQALSSVGVPVCSSAITTVGSAAFLTMCQLQLFKRFGEIIVINTVVSITLTLTLLPALLAAFGPGSFKGSVRRSLIAALMLASFVGIIILSLYFMAEDGNRVRGPTGNFVF